MTTQRETDAEAKLRLRRVQEAILALRGHPQWKVLRQDYFEFLRRLEEAIVMVPIDTANDVYVRERAKGAAILVRNMLAYFDSIQEPEEHTDATD